jgi:hypothetical protein
LTTSTPTGSVETLADWGFEPAEIEDLREAGALA